MDCPGGGGGGGGHFTLVVDSLPLCRMSGGTFYTGGQSALPQRFEGKPHLGQLIACSTVELCPHAEMVKAVELDHPYRRQRASLKPLYAERNHLRIGEP